MVVSETGCGEYRRKPNVQSVDPLFIAGPRPEMTLTVRLCCTSFCKITRELYIMMLSGYINIDIRYTRILLYDIYRVLDSYLTYIGLFLNCYLIRFLFEDWAQRCPEVGFQARCNSAKVSTRCSCAAFVQTMMFVSIRD